MVTTVGELLRHWRVQRRLSQLDLATEAEVSTRHLSCLETGRARPSRDMVLVLASALEVPLRERNTLLQAAGFAPAYRETDLNAPELVQVRAALDHLLRAHEPFSAVVVDRLWTIRKGNSPFLKTWSAMLGRDPVGTNLLEATFRADMLRPFLMNFEAIAAVTLDRLQREAMTAADPELFALHERLSSLPGVPTQAAMPRWDQPAALFIPFSLRLGERVLNLFSTITTLGTPVDVTLAELRIESYFPADDATETFLRAMA